MTPHATSYAAFMLDYAAGALSPAEALAAGLHRALSGEGRRSADMLDSVGGALLEESPPRDVRRIEPTAKPVRVGAGSWIIRDAPPDDELTRLLNADLIALPWRRTLFGVRELPVRTPMAHLLRLDPGERAPHHAHGRRDVTVVLCGAFEDGHATYRRGDLAFAEPGLKHQPGAVGDEPCVCLIATEAGRPISALLGVLGIPGLPSPRRRDVAA